MIDSSTRVVVQGITGKAGSLHTKTMLEYGTNIVAGVRPGAEGEEVHGILVYNKVKSAVAEHDANASILFVPGPLVKGAALEAINAGIRLLVIIPEHVPIHDTIEIMEHARKKGAAVVGPNTAGLIYPEYKCKIGFVPNKYFIPGPVGIGSRSGTLMYELVARLTRSNIGQSLCVGVGGDPIVGMRFPQLLRIFQKDKNTKAILLIGEIGGTQEEDAAELVVSGEITKPVVAYMAGHSAPKEKKIGHAGAIVSGEKGTMESKLRAFEKAGIGVAKTPGEVVNLICKSLENGLVWGGSH